MKVTFKYSNDDLLGVIGPIDVMGIQLDATVKLVLRMDSTTRIVEIDSLDVDDVGVLFENGVVELDQDSFWGSSMTNSLSEKFYKLLEAEALKFGENLPEEHWESSYNYDEVG